MAGEVRQKIYSQQNSIANCGSTYELLVSIMEIGNLKRKDICTNVYLLLLTVIGRNDNCHLTAEINLSEVHLCINAAIFSSISYQLQKKFGVKY